MEDVLNQKKRRIYAGVRIHRKGKVFSGILFESDKWKCDDEVILEKAYGILKELIAKAFNSSSPQDGEFKSIYHIEFCFQSNNRFSSKRSYAQEFNIDDKDVWGDPEKVLGCEYWKKQFFECVFELVSCDFYPEEPRFF